MPTYKTGIPVNSAVADVVLAKGAQGLYSQGGKVTVDMASRQAQCHAVVEADGTISSIVVDDGGFGYVVAPTVDIDLPLTGTDNATTTNAIISQGKLVSVDIDFAGSGYQQTHPPAVKCSGGKGTGTTLKVPAGVAEISFSKVRIPAGATFATLTLGAGASSVIYTSKLGGSAGNAITISLVDPTPTITPTTTVTSVVGTAITIRLSSNGSAITATADDVSEAVGLSAAASALITAVPGGAGTGLVAAHATVNLATGADDAGAAAGVVALYV
jgi:hypothetical protein